MIYVKYLLLWFQILFSKLRLKPSVKAEQLYPHVGRALGRGLLRAAEDEQLTTDVLVGCHYPVAGLSVGESGKLQGTPSPFQSPPALSGADSASPQTYCVKIAHQDLQH